MPDLERMDSADYSGVIKNAVILPDDASCPVCGYFDTSREDVKAALRSAGKKISDAACKGTHPYCISVRW